MSSLRKTFGAAALLAATSLTTTACGGRDAGPSDAGDRPGCTGVCSDGSTEYDAGTTDGGSDAGTDAGTTPTGPTVMTLREVRDNATRGKLVRVEQAVVGAISRSFQGSKGDYLADFWVVDPASPTDGIWVEKYFFDTPTAYEPQVGHVLSLEGYFDTNSKYEDIIAYRKTLKSEYDINKGKGLLKMTLLDDAGTVVYNEVDAGSFGDAQGGLVGANPGYAGSLVHIRGPLELTNPNPTALEVVADIPEPEYNGFEVSGGILVNHGKTEDYTLSDGGYVERCDWRKQAIEGKTVTFPNGIRGVWESYSHAPCADGGTSTFSCYPNLEGRVPGAVLEDGGTARYTFVVYPQSCEDLGGVAVEPSDAGTP